MLPTLDISDFLANPHSMEAQRFVTDLINTCHNPGFFYLVGHGIPENMDNEILQIAQQFFSLPLEQRHQIAIGQSPHFRGYTILGDERTQGRRDWRDQLDIGPEEPALSLAKDDPIWLRLRGPNQWPASLPQMQTIVMRWMNRVEMVCLCMIRALALGLGQKMDYFDSRMYPQPYTRLKISRYPGQPQKQDLKQNQGKDQGQNQSQGQDQGLGLHHDSGLFTLILQDQVPGLEVEIGGELQTIAPLAGAYVVNLGEMFQVATNGYLRATKHRVKSPEGGKQRISIAYFMNPRLDAVFESVDLPPELAEKARGSQNENPDDPVYPVFGDNTLKVRMRAHPDVVEKFYSDMRGRSQLEMKYDE